MRIYQDKTPKRGHQVGSERKNKKKQISLKSPLTAILCNDIIACLNIFYAPLRVYLGRSRYVGPINYAQVFLAYALC